MRRRAICAASVGSARPETSLEDVTVLGFKNTQAGVEQLPLRHDHDVEAGRDLVSTENLSYQSLGAVPLDRAAQFLRSGDSEPASKSLVSQDENRPIPAVNPDAPRVHPLEIRSSANPFAAAERTSCPATSGMNVRPVHVSIRC